MSEPGPAAVVVIPIRAFAGGKSRLEGALPPGLRAELLALLADRVAEAASGMPRVVVSSAPEVRSWALERGLDTIADPGSLNRAAEAGRRWAVGLGAGRVIVAHSDLPLARTMAPLAEAAPTGAVIAVRCHRGDGTPVLSLPTALPFRFGYGPGSFLRHVKEAARHGLALRRLAAPDLELDIDAPPDLLLAVRESPLLDRFLRSRGVDLPAGATAPVVRMST